MTPAASWSPADYYLAIDRARLAWQRSQPQLTIEGVLEEVQAARAGGGESTAAACISSSASQPHPLPLDGADALVHNTNGPDRIAREALRGRGQSGAQ